MYGYLIGALLSGVLWLVFFWRAGKGLRRSMLTTGLLYLGSMIILFWLQKFAGLFFAVSQTYNPGYWHPDTLFDLSNRLGGASLEDGLFVFFSAGIVSVLYEFAFRKNLSVSSKKPLPWPVAVYFLTYLVLMFTGINPVYLLIVPALAGAVAIWILRNDLVRNSLFSGAAFTVLYAVLFVVFLWMFPGYVQANYNLGALMGVWFLGLPLEEFLYAFTFGLFWGPVYKATVHLKPRAL